MLPRPGCAEILPTRSRVSDELPSCKDGPGAASVLGGESMGRRGVRMEKARGEDWSVLGMSEGAEGKRDMGRGTVVVR